MMTPDLPKGFNDYPYPYHHEINLEIESLTNLGYGIARDTNGWVIQVPFVIPGETVLGRIYRNYKNYSVADCIKVLQSSERRVNPKCDLFGICGGCQYQHLAYDQQLVWKRNQVHECFAKISGINLEVNPTVASPKTYGYRSKLTPHYDKPQNGLPRKLGFLKHGAKRALVDVTQCMIATDAINHALPQSRKALLETKTKRGGTVLLRDTLDGVVQDPKQLVTEKVNGLVFQFKAGEFFQNNPFLLPALVDYVVEQANPSVCSSLVDAYCGGGLFSLSAAKSFQKVVGIEISRDGFEGARTNAAINKIENAEFFLGDASTIFSELDQTARPFSLIIDPPRKGCDPGFLEQTLSFRPKRIVYVSCEPSTQARDAKVLVDKGYRILASQPFDLFPQTRHIENVLTLEA